MDDVEIFLEEGICICNWECQECYISNDDPPVIYICIECEHIIKTRT